MWPSTPPPPRVTAESPEGLEALESAHSLFSNQDLLICEIFPRIYSWNQMNVKLMCMKWKIWWDLRWARSWLNWMPDESNVENQDMSLYFDGLDMLLEEA